MLRDKETSKQKEYEIVLLDDLVPQDHILRKIDAAVDFSFIHDLCKDLYSPNIGRPAIEPELLFRMLFLGYLYGIKSETKLAQEVNENIAFKWFLGLRLAEKGPDHATISANRVRRFRDHNIAEKIFDNILQQCIDRKLVGGNILYTDSTHIKAKANKHKKKLVEVAVTPKAYLSELDAQVDQEREGLGKKPFDRDDEAHKGGGSATRMQSTTDPESGQQSRDWETERFLLQRTPHRGQQAQCDRKRACGSGKHQRRDTDARNTRRDRSKAGHAAQIHGTGRGIPQRMDSASAGDERDTRGDRVPAAHAQRGALREVPLPLRPGSRRIHLPGETTPYLEDHDARGIPAILL